METNKITALKWFTKNYLGIYIVLGLILPITGIYFLLTNGIPAGIITLLGSLTLGIWSFRKYVRDDYYQDVIKFKSVERWKSNFLHLLFLPNLKK